MRGLGLKGFGLRVGFQTTTRASTGRTGFGVSYKVNIILRIPRVIPSNSPNVVRTPPPSAFVQNPSGRCENSEARILLMDESSMELKRLLFSAQGCDTSG